MEFLKDVTTFASSASEFLLVGEPLAVDLVNTRGQRDDSVVDLLDGPAALNKWLHVERAHTGWGGGADSSDLVAVRKLRDAIDHLLRASVAHTQPHASALRVLNRTLSMRVPLAQLSWASGDPHSVWPEDASMQRVFLRRVALSALEVLTGPKAAWLRQCAHPDCILLFVASNGRRRWCSSTRCGNRARVARHYSRARTRVR